MTARRAKLKRALKLLERCYGRRPWRSWGPPVPVLVETILSQNTNGADSQGGLPAALAAVSVVERRRGRAGGVH